MNVGWLLDAGIFGEYHDELADAIVRHGFVVKSINRPNAPNDWDVTGQAYRKAFPLGACVVTHADIDLVVRVLANRLWTPGAFANVERFHCSQYFSHFGKFLLNQDYVMLPFAELSRRRDFLFDAIGKDDRIFVRPDSPLKLFTGLVASRDTFDRDLDFMAFYEFPAESLVVVSSPKSIVKEWRFVVSEQAIVAGSQYRDGDDQTATPGYEGNACEIAEAVLATGYAPDPVWIIDICKTDGGEFRLLEIGGFSFSNLYASDKNAVVNAVSKAAQSEYAKRQRVDSENDRSTE